MKARKTHAVPPLAAAATHHPLLRHWREAVPHDRLAHLVRDASRAFQKSLQIRLAQQQIAFGHWTFLRILWESDGLTQKELSERAGVMEPSTFAAMKAMETLGYIERKQLPTNRKNVYVHLTAHGCALKRKLVPLAIESNHVAVQNLTEQDVQTTRRVLLAMIENLTADDLTNASMNPGTKPGTKPGANRSAPSPPKRKKPLA